MPERASSVQGGHFEGVLKLDWKRWAPMLSRWMIRRRWRVPFEYLRT